MFVQLLALVVTLKILPSWVKGYLLSMVLFFIGYLLVEYLGGYVIVADALTYILCGAFGLVLVAQWYAVKVHNVCVITKYLKFVKWLKQQ